MQLGLVDGWCRRIKHEWWMLCITLHILLISHHNHNIFFLSVLFAFLQNTCSAKVK